MFKLGLIGYPLGHSFSAAYFNGKFSREGIDGVYNIYPIESITQLTDIIEIDPGILGLNVTVPYKEQVLDSLDLVSAEAQEIGAVNVVSIDYGHHKKPFLTGFNTDCIGFRESVRSLLRNDVRSALVLGTGGASKAVCHALKQLGIDFTLISRTPVTDSGYRILAYDQLNENIIKRNRLIVNATPVGMYPKVDDAPPIPYNHLTDLHILYDLIYNPEETKFMRLGRAKGAKVKNGLEMLHRQAEAAWDIWRHQFDL